jgi:hypothetical protein
MRVHPVLELLKMSSSAATPSSVSWRFRACSACAVVLLFAYLALSSAAIAREPDRAGTSNPQVVIAQAAAAGAQTGQSGGGVEAASASATLEQCVPASAQSERSASFAGEMTAMSGSARMAIRIEIQEQTPGEALFHTIVAPGLGVWRASDPGVKAYKYVKQVTNLFAPASYRATVRFRWLNAKGHQIKSAQRHTPRCEQPASTPFPVSASFLAEGSSSVSG